MDEVNDVLTCARETPESPYNVERIEILVEETRRLRTELSMFDGCPRSAIRNAIDSLVEHHDGRDALVIDWLRKISSREYFERVVM